MSGLRTVWTYRKNARAKVGEEKSVTNDPRRYIDLLSETDGLGDC